METIDRTEIVSFLSCSGCTIPQSTPEIISEIEKQMREVICDKYKDGCRTFMCGMREGFELISVAELLKLKKYFPDISFVAVLWHIKQSYEYSDKAKVDYNEFLHRADSIVVLSEKCAESGFGSYLDYFIENSSTIVSCFDDQTEGASLIIDKSENQGVKIINVCKLFNEAISNLEL